MFYIYTFHCNIPHAPSKINGLKTGTFYEEFSEFVEKLFRASGKVIILGDFNIFFGDTSGLAYKRFVDIVETFDFVQHIDKPTHNSGHLLDYIITRKDSSGVSNVYVTDFNNNNNNNNCLKSNIQCIEIRVQWTVHLGSSHMHVHAVTRVHAVTPKLVICVMYLTSI